MPLTDRFVNDTTASAWTRSGLEPARAARPFYDLPLLPGTVFWMQLSLAEEALNLNRIARALEQDPIAVLRLFSLSPSSAFDELEADCLRIEDRLVGLDRGTLEEAFCKQKAVNAVAQAAVIQFAQEAFLFAELSGEVARSLGLPRDEAFLIGLLHNIGSLPARLSGDSMGNDSHLAETLPATCYRALPPALGQALVDLQQSGTRSKWTPVMDAAYELLESNGAKCVSEKGKVWG